MKTPDRENESTAESAAAERAGVPSIRPDDAPMGIDVQSPIASGLVNHVRLVDSASAERRTRFVLSIWLGIAAALWLVMYVLAGDAPFQEPHAWVSAHFSTVARSFGEHGIWQLGFVPVQNNAPLGTSPDFYTHWPPLFPVILSVLFGVLGESEAVLRGFMLVILLANTAALMWLTRTIGNTVAALVAGLFVLGSPVLEEYALIGLPMHLAILGMILGVLGFVKAQQHDRIHRGWAAFGIVALMLGCMASWEPVLATPGLFAVALMQRRRASIVLSIIFGCAAALAVVLVLGNYMLQLPSLAADLWDTILVRVFHRDYPADRIDIHFIVNREEYATYAKPTVTDLLDTYGRRSLYLIGRLGLLGLGWAFIAGWINRRAARSYGPAYAVGGLLAAWALWFVLMNNHAFVHDFMMSLLVPAAGVCVGLLAASVHRTVVQSSTAPALRRSIIGALFMLAPALLIVSLLRGVLSSRTPEPTGPLVRYSRAIERNTEPGAVVLSTSPSMVPVFYSRRQVIRAVLNDDIVDEVLAQVSVEFPGAPVFVAIEPRYNDRFARTIASHEAIVNSTDLHLLRLTLDEGNGIVRAGDMD